MGIISFKYLDGGPIGHHPYNRYINTHKKYKGKRFRYFIKIVVSRSSKFLVTLLVIIIDHILNEWQQYRVKESGDSFVHHHNSVQMQIFKICSSGAEATLETILVLELQREFYDHLYVSDRCSAPVPTFKKSHHCEVDIRKQDISIPG